jgi:hypothetical protein
MHCERLLELVHPMIKMYSAAGGCLSISAAARAWQLGDVRRNASSPHCGSFCQIDIDVRGSQFFCSWAAEHQLCQGHFSNPWRRRLIFRFGASAGERLVAAWNAGRYENHLGASLRERNLIDLGAGAQCGAPAPAAKDWALRAVMRASVSVKNSVWSPSVTRAAHSGVQL